MSSVSFNRKKAKLKHLLGIRARLALLALILVTPLMLERARSLEDTRSKQVELASAEFANLAKHSADAQQEVISSVETLLKSAAYIRASAGGIGRSCDLLRASVPANLPWIRSLSIVGRDGRIQCSTLNILVGIDLSVRQLDTIPLLSAIAEAAVVSDQAEGSRSFVAADGSKRTVDFVRIAGTDSRLIVSIDEARVSTAINRDIRTAYFQLGFVSLFVLLGALIAAERLIIAPIEMMAATAKRFGQGDWSARAPRGRLPAEFVPLARALNAMA